MIQSLDDLTKRYEVLFHEWGKRNHDVNACLELIKEIMSGLTRFAFMPKQESDASRRELLIARDTLEIATILATEKQDIPSFEHYMSQLKCYYYDYKDSLPDSPLKYELIGLNLLCLLAQGRLADFHTELERLSKEEIRSNVYIENPVAMEQYLMEGSFHKVFLSKGFFPSRRYDFFIDILINTTRDEVASCIEAAYEKLSLKDATPTLFFDSEEAMLQFGKKRGWVLDKGVYRFSKETKQVDDVIPSTDVTKVMLEYTKELDQII